MPNASTETPAHDFVPTGHGNYLFSEQKGADWWVSYNPAPSSNPISGFYETMLTLATGEDSTKSAETALEVGVLWFIMNGDHREQIRASWVMDGKRGVLSYFLDQYPEPRHRWSTGSKDDLAAMVAEASSAA